MKTNNVKKIIESIVIVIVCAIVVFCMIYPTYYMITASIKTSEEYWNPVPTFFPHTFSLWSYKLVFGKIEVFGQFFLNSLYVAVLIPILQTIVCLPAAYALARLKFIGKNLFFIIFISGMMLPGLLTIIQNFKTMVGLKLINNPNSIVLISIFSPSCIFMMRQFFLGLPKELEEAGRIDGCNAFKSFVYVVAPLSIPSIAVNLILCFNGVWGDYFTPMIMLRSQESMTLPVGMTVIMGALNTGDPTVLMAALTLTCIPCLIMFFVFRKKLIDGLASSGLKM